MLELLRSYLPDRTTGKLVFEDGTLLCTIERPWIDNKPRISCIPEGVYRLVLRDSAIVNRTSNGKYQQGWEVTEVKDRSLIMLHIANFPYELEGCIAPGLKLAILPGKHGMELAAVQSRVAFELLMNKLGVRKEWYLEIKKA